MSEISFEGREKLTEIWFSPSPSDLPPKSAVHPSATSGIRDDPRRKGLRRVKREVWEEMLDMVKCKVLSVIEGQSEDGWDAYLLSESSMFVSPHMIILKTCGTTINLHGLERIIEIAKSHCGFERVFRCFYSRKTFLFPENQIGPHKEWRDEVQYLDRLFDGSAYVVGPTNGDNWMLYIYLPEGHAFYPPSLHSLEPGPPASSLSNAVASTSSSRSPSVPLRVHLQDQTLEILMQDLSAKAREPFFHPEHLYLNKGQERTGHSLGDSITRHLGLDDLFPKEETTWDSFGFEPCGYSSNAIVGNGAEGAQGYVSVHVTPEEGWSYASVECGGAFALASEQSEETEGGMQRPDVQTLIRRVVNIFEPGRLSLTLFVSTPSADATDAEATQAGWVSFAKDLLGKTYRRTDNVRYEYDGYHLVFGSFVRNQTPQANGA